MAASKTHPRRIGIHQSVPLRTHLCFVADIFCPHSTQELELCSSTSTDHKDQPRSFRFTSSRMRSFAAEEPACDSCRLEFSEQLLKKQGLSAVYALLEDKTEKETADTDLYVFAFHRFTSPVLR